MDPIINVIDNNTLVSTEIYTSIILETESSFFDYPIEHCDIIGFGTETNQVEFWCTQEKINNLVRTCYCIDSPDIELLKVIWDKCIGSRKSIKQFMKKNKPIPGLNDSDTIWAMAVVLGNIE